MRRYCFADSHTCDGGEKDDFMLDNLLISLCEQVMVEKDSLLIGVGDIFETWQCCIDDIYQAHKNVLDTLCYVGSKGKLIVLLGNHDNDDSVVEFWNRHGIATYREYRCGNILFMHGDQFDIFNSRLKWIGKTVTWLGGVLEKLIHRDIDKWFEKAAQWVMGTGRHGNEMKYAEKAVDYIRDMEGVNTVVLGHLHKLQKNGIRIGNKTYFNTGTMMIGDYLVFETA